MLCSFALYNIANIIIILSLLFLINFFF